MRSPTVYVAGTEVHEGVEYELGRLRIEGLAELVLTGHYLTNENEPEHYFHDDLTLTVRLEGERGGWPQARVSYITPNPGILLSGLSKGRWQDATVAFGSASDLSLGEAALWAEALTLIACDVAPILETVFPPGAGYLKSEEVMARAYHAAQFALEQR